MFTEQEFRHAFRAQVDAEVADVVGPDRVTAPIPVRRRPRWPLVAAAAASVLVVGGVGLVGAHLLETKPAPPAVPEAVGAVTVEGAVVPDEDVADVRLQSVDGCLAIDPDTLLVVNKPVWSWAGAAGELRWLPSSQSEGYHLGDEFQLGGQRVAVGDLDQPVLPTSCADFDGDLWLAGTPLPRGADDPPPFDVRATPEVAVATVEQDSGFQALGGGTLNELDGCVMLGDALLVVGPSWFWDAPRAVLVDLRSATEFHLGDLVRVAGNGVEIGDGDVSLGGPLTLPASCASYEGLGWYAGPRGGGDGDGVSDGPTGVQRTKVAHAIGAVRDRYPGADGGGVYDRVTSTYTMWIVDDAPDAERYRAELTEALAADTSGSTTMVTKTTEISDAEGQALARAVADAANNDPEFPGFGFSGGYSPADQAVVLHVGSAWNDPAALEYLYTRFGDTIVLSSIEPAVAESIGP
ncbi:hypothetical protein KIN34_07690 [Cellulomonas sp. DKR-3]|uniref:LigA protein n=1 Tax=Cellulomonas fulva TaxID=2835530 RepID=A0ABS5TYE1_9CELL|nr:hypothetical protein [Cellulomonas fulva]MBT0994165.1 hypothetical protein [Cellulomonas fulva]